MDVSCGIHNIIYIHAARIESVQKQFLLFALRNLRWDGDRAFPPYKSRLKLIDLSSLGSRRVMLGVTFLHKLINGEVNSLYLINRLAFNVPTRTRFYHPLNLNLCITNFADNSPFRVICKNYNELYVHFVNDACTNLVKRSLLYVLNL